MILTVTFLQVCCPFVASLLNVFFYFVMGDYKLGDSKFIELGAFTACLDAAKKLLGCSDEMKSKSAYDCVAGIEMERRKIELLGEPKSTI